jgi:Na+/H+-dicarboxylate symporter
LVSLIKGITSLSDISSLSRLGFKTISLYLITTVVAIVIGITAANIFQPGKTISEEKRLILQDKYKTDTESKEESANKLKESGPLSFVENMVPDNIISAGSKNENMLQVIVFAILLGISLILIPAKDAEPVLAFFNGLNEAILKLVDIIMMFAPIGVMGLMAGVLVNIGGDDISAAGELLFALGAYSLTVLGSLFFIILLIYPLMFKLFTNKIGYLEFFKGIFPAQMLAFSTSSSAATLPLTMERCEEHIGISKKIAGFVLPIGATINMDGTSCYQAVAALFIAQAFGIDLTIGQQATIVLTAVLASIGSAAVPGAGTVMLVIVLTSVGIEPEGIALILAPDRLLDMFRTVVNVTGDATVTTIIASTENELNRIPEKV